MSRIKIDLQNKLLEIEGEENFIRDIYDQSRSLFAVSNNIESGHNMVTRRQRKSGGLKESYAIIKNLDLSQPAALKEFYAGKPTASALEKNAVFVYYLSKIANIKNINLNHIYSCYKEVGTKLPEALKQSLADTSSKKGWIDTKSMSDIKITLKGEGKVMRELIV